MNNPSYEERCFRFFHSLFFILCVSLFFILGVCLLLPVFQASLLSFGNRLSGKSLSQDVWKPRFIEWGGKILLPSCLFFVYLLRERIEEQGKCRFDRIFLLCIFFVWGIVCLLTIFLHEPWRDEVQAWLIAKAYSPAKIFHEMRYEGHFVPWFYLVFPFAKLGFPAISLNLLSFCIMGACVALLLFRSPFNIYAKAACVFALPMLYYYPVVSRCYCLYALAVLLIACYFKKRTEHPFLYALFLGLLANSHAYAEGLVAILTAEALFTDIILPWKTLTLSERKRRFAAMGLVCLLVLVAFCQVAPAFGNSSATENGHRLSIETFFDVFIQVFRALDLSSFSQFLVLFFAFLSFRYLAWNKEGRLLLIVELSFLWMILFAVLLYGPSIPNRAWMWFFIFLLVFWQLDAKAGSLLLLLLSIASCNPEVNVRDWNREFSSARSTAAYMKEHFSPSESIYLPHVHQNYAIVFFAPEYEYRSLETGKESRLFSWTKDSKDASGQDLNVYIRERFAESAAPSIVIVGLNNLLEAARLAYRYDILLDPLPTITGESYSVLRVYDEAIP